MNNIGELVGGGEKFIAKGGRKNIKRFFELERKR